MKFLKDLVASLPINCLFDKGKIGCGGTSMAIECGEPYVIAVPFSSLVTNKFGQYPNDRYPHHVFAVMEGVTVADVERYLGMTEVPKIVTTYDGLPKVVEALGEKVLSMNLLVDEYHLLFRQYGFREPAIKSILDLYGRFLTYTFMTGTPLESDFILDELKHLPIVVQEWPKSEKLNVTVRAVKCKRVMASAIKLIKRFLVGDESGNLYIFVNSVSVIEKLVSGAELTRENCRVVYSKYNNRVISYRQGESKITIPNSTVEDTPKKINMLTSTVFEGCDILDSEGKTVILSDPFHKQTMLDISTSVNQIAGRIRNSRYIGEILHLFQESGYRELSYDKYKDHIKKETEMAEKVVEGYNSIADEDIRKNLTNEPNKYIYKKDNRLFFDKNLPKVDLFNYKVQNDYSSTVTLSAEYVGQNISVKLAVDQAFKCDPSRLVDGAGINMTFKEVVQELRRANTTIRSILLKDALVYYPFLGEAINKLGFERIETLNYVQKDIKNELLKISDSTNEEKVFLKLGYENGMFYSNSTIKRDLRNAYDSLGYDMRIAVATDIPKYYDVRNYRKRINGKQVPGYIILGPKY